MVDFKSFYEYGSGFQEILRFRITPLHQLKLSIPAQSSHPCFENKKPGSKQKGMGWSVPFASRAAQPRYPSR